MNDSKKTIVNKTKSVYRKLKQLNNCSLEKQEIVLSKLLNVLRKELKQNKSCAIKTDNQNSLEKVYDKIFDEINNLGYPFTKTRKDLKYDSYKRSLKLIAKYYKRYRYEIVEIFKLGKLYFLNPGFIYKPEKKISIANFFEYDKSILQNMPHLSKYTKSWFKEFAKGREHIEKRFMKETKDKHPSLTKDFIIIWQKFRKEDCSQFDLNNIKIFVDQCYRFSKLNNISTRTIFNSVTDYLNSQQNDFIKTAKYLTTDYFWKQEFPNFLITQSIFKYKRDIKFLKKEN